MTTQKQNIQWHPGFYSGYQLELVEYKDILKIETEHELSQKPLRVDLLVVRKDGSREITNPIASFYKRYNLIEYKSPDDELSIDDYFKVIGYAGIYKSLGKRVDSISVEDMTLSIFRSRYPEELMKKLRALGALVTEEAPGVFKTEGMFFVPVWIVVTSMLDEAHTVMKVLARGASADDIKRFMDFSSAITEKDDKENADAVLEVSLLANRDMFEEVRRENDMMGPALREFMKDDIEASEAKGRKEG
jgi:hypothetical protein